MRFIPLLLLQFLAIPLFAQQASSGPHGGLRPFGSDAELLSYFRKMRDEQERARLATDSAYRRYVAELAKCSSDSIPAHRSSLPATTQSADAVIGGRTIDSGNQPQSLVSVVVPELGLKTTTGADGRYQIVIPAESLQTSRRLTVRALRIGFNAAVRTVTVGRRDAVELNLRLCGGAALALEQVVVVGAAAAVTVDGVGLKSEQITNTQHAGVDEGGIVKVHGDHLVILRRGRLFTVAIGGSDLTPSAAVNAFGPDVDPTGTWYDELLVSGNKVVVIGYSYDRGGTEVGVFNIDARGRLDYVATYELRSNDYYSDRNYASRLIGTKLIFYAPLYLWNDVDNPLAALPAVRRWYRDGHDTTFKRIAPAPRIYRSPGQLNGDDIALHTVTICDLAQTSLGCQATVIVGPSGRVFYVSPRAVYVWTSAWTRSGKDDQDGMLYRMPLDGSTPSALGVAGSPVDQFSFLESDDGRLNVLVRSEAYGDAMWLPEWATGDVALLRVPITAFGDGDDRAPWWQYRRLPTPTDGDDYAFHNRFVGEYLLYGLGSGWGRPRGDSATVLLVRWTGAGNGAVSALRLAHGVDRIEQMGGDAVVVGADSDDLHFTGIRLTGAPVLAQRYTMAGASQGETRSHGFFYRVDGADTGVLGLPVSQAGRPGYRQLIDGSAGVLFLRNQGQRFQPLGVLRTRAKETNDQCLASCVDWYGNARPLFLRGRVFALLGYEVVEGTITGDSIQEVRRISFAPAKQTVAR